VGAGDASRESGNVVSSDGMIEVGVAQRVLRSECGVDATDNYGKPALLREWMRDDVGRVIGVRETSVGGRLCHLLGSIGGRSLSFVYVVRSSLSGW
jgi:hypothetical protein